MGSVWPTFRSRGKRNNGSKRKAKVKLHRAGTVQSWLRDGFKMCSINCAGISAFKIFLLLEQHQPDLLCLQETWLVGSFGAPLVDGYTWYEHRRSKGKRGGIAILVRKGISVLTHHSTEFA